MSSAEIFLFFANIGSLYLGYHLGREYGFKRGMQMIFERAQKNHLLAAGLAIESEKAHKIIKRLARGR